jgi:SAM-dependent methyltransferase
MRLRDWLVLGLLGVLAWIVWSDLRGARWHPLARRRVAAMLDLADVGPGDRVYDLGAGDGRIAIEAGRRGAACIGIEIDPVRARWARATAARAHVDDRVTIVQGDLFGLDLSDADVIVCFLTQATNEALEAKLLREAKPGARIVSAYHTFPNLELVAEDPAARILAYRLPQELPAG